jgi:hypothetical protein
MLFSEALGKNLTWSLQLAEPTFQADALSARITLRVVGLSASGNEVVAEGMLLANRLEVSP